MSRGGGEKFGFNSGLRQTKTSERSRKSLNEKLKNKRHYVSRLY